VGVSIGKVWEKGAVLGETHLIFVTVGGMRPFDRLVRVVDRIAGKLDEKVVMQIGSTDFEPKNCRYFRFVPQEEIDKWYSDARVIIAHAGIGTILAVLEHNKPLILVPRMKRYGEVFDDHQLEIAREMEKRGITVVHDLGNLESAIEIASLHSIRSKDEATLVRRLKEYLDKMDRQGI
jgi:beta-1,4-N-acetylglucosaminyltransferase